MISVLIVVLHEAGKNKNRVFWLCARPVGEGKSCSADCYRKLVSNVWLTVETYRVRQGTIEGRSQSGVSM